jgi:transcriptional regulator with GAF, ATPase, and Fis domain
MKRQVDLIDQFADLVLGADDPRRLAERTLEVVMSLNNGRSGAVFALENDQLSLYASRGIDQGVLDAVQAVWSKYRESLETGEIFYVPDRSVERRLPEDQRGKGGASSFALVPVLEGQGLLALLYVDSVDPHFCESHDLARLTKLARIVAKAVRKPSSAAPLRARESGAGWEAYLERTPVEDMEREKLLLLLNRNEWNIARVSRLMGVTRRTIYLRLARYNIPRERVPKGRPRR